MTESTLTLSSEEREFLSGLLEETMKEARVEEHRTRTLSFRQYVLQREELIASLLKKLRVQ